MIRGRFWLLLLAPLGLLLAGCSGRPASKITSPGGLAPGPFHKASVIVHATASGTDSLYLKFGAGANLRVTVSTPTNPDTTSFPGTVPPSDTTWWSYVWSVPAASTGLVELGTTSSTQPTNTVALLGTSNINITSATVRYDVLHHVKMNVAGTPTDVVADTVATGFLRIGFHRVPARDITASIDVYHVVRSVTGGVASATDSVQAVFVNNDLNRSELPAGPLTAAGALLTVHHLADGQEYSGKILFKIPQNYGFQTRDDPQSLVPSFNVNMDGPQNELLLTSPDGRIPVDRAHPPSLQWTGANDSTTIAIDLSDSFGHTLHLEALDNGRYDLSEDQLMVFTPGIMTVVLTRIMSASFPNVANPPPLSLNIRLIEETHASFFYH